MRVLVVGGGGREHAIVRTLGRSAHAPELYCTPGNAGIAADAEVVEAAKGVVPGALDIAADLVVIGPEVPLVAGLADDLEEAGIAAFGPSAAAARLEGSKLYAKEAMREAGVPTAEHLLAASREQALAHLDGCGYPVVLKADGLAAGKGVIIAADRAEATAAVDAFFTEQRFGATQVLIEEFLEGEELSMLALCDGHNVVPLAPAQDYKRSSTATAARTPAGWAATRRSRGSTTTRSPAPSPPFTSRSSS